MTAWKGRRAGVNRSRRGELEGYRLSTYVVRASCARPCPVPAPGSCSFARGGRTVEPHRPPRVERSRRAGGRLPTRPDAISAPACPHGRGLLRSRTLPPEIRIRTVFTGALRFSRTGRSNREWNSSLHGFRGGLPGKKGGWATNPSRAQVLAWRGARGLWGDTVRLRPRGPAALVGAWLPPRRHLRAGLPPTVGACCASPKTSVGHLDSCGSSLERCGFRGPVGSTRKCNSSVYWLRGGLPGRKGRWATNPPASGR